jgi:hypothetical protein
MKFAILDTHTDGNTQRVRGYSDTYQYLDDLLDKTFLTDYFLDRPASAGGAAPAPAPSP